MDRGRIVQMQWISACVAHCVERGIVDEHPTYLLDFIIWPHHGGPGCGRVLATWDGLLLGQMGVLEPKQAFDARWGKFETSLHDFAEFPEAEAMADAWRGLRPGRAPWNASDSEIAQMLVVGIDDESIAFHVTSDGHRDQLYTRIPYRNTVVAITGVSIRIDDCVDWLRASLGVPFQRNRSLWDRAWTYGDDVGTLVAEALATYPFSTRGCVALLRTAAERVLATEALNAGITLTGDNFNSDIDAYRTQWSSRLVQGTSKQPDAAERARGEHVIAALHRVRDIGNKIHGTAQPGHVEALEAIGAMEGLLRAIVGDDPAYRTS